MKIQQILISFILVTVDTVVCPKPTRLHFPNSVFPNIIYNIFTDVIRHITSTGLRTGLHSLLLIYNPDRLSRELCLALSIGSI